MQPESRKKWAIALLALVLFVVVARLGWGVILPTGQTARKIEPAGEQEDALEQTQELLAKGNDLSTCRTVLQQVNVYLSQHADQRTAPLVDEQRHLLTDPQHFGLDAGELAEVENSSFTLLDAHHLDLCFLFHDAAGSLEVKDLPQSQQAAAAFAWVVRQVRLADHDEELAPPDFVLRRGWGTPAERALVYLCLLEQLGIPGCVVGTPGDKADLPRIWACGALPAGKDRAILLFDPRLGLPLPGREGNANRELAVAYRLSLSLPLPGEREVATLAAVRSQPGLFEVLNADAKHRYDVTAEQVQQTRIYLTGMLSALAPRMKFLQEEVPSLRGTIRLAFEPQQAVATWTAAAAAQGDKAPAVDVWREAMRVQRRFWPAEEGGNDTRQVARQRMHDLVPWQLLPQKIKELPGEPGQRLQQFFGRPFAEFFLGPQTPRDLVLRGRFDEAARELVKTRDQMRDARDRLRAAVDLDERMDQWSEQVIKAQANYLVAQRAQSHPGSKGSAEPGSVEMAKAQLDQVWKNGQEVLVILIEGRAADVRGPETTYLMALCKQEQAERLELARHAGRTVPPEEMQAAWQDAADWWAQFLGDQPAAAAEALARLRQARAKVALGQRAEALRLLEVPATGLTPLDETARAFLIQKLKKP